MTYDYSKQYSLVDPEDDPMNLVSVMPADFSDHQVNDSPQADPFYQGKAATGAVVDNPYSTRGALLREQADAASSEAIANLNRALNNRPQVSKEQGLTAALLGLVPTVGGAIIGSAVGKPKLPPGTFGVKLEETGMGAGGMMGAKAGMKASQDYLSSLDTTKEDNDILMRLAEYQNRRGQTLLNEANQTEIAKLNQEQIDARQQNYLALQRELAGNKPAPRQTENEVISTAMSKLQQSNPQLYQKLLGDVNALTPEEKLQIPPELMPTILAKTQQKKDFSFGGLPAAMQDSIRKSKFVVDEARSIASDIEKSGNSWASYQAAKGLSAADTQGLGLRLTYLADSLARAKSGAALNKQEEETYGKMAKGDISAEPAQVAHLLRVLAESEAKQVLSMKPLLQADSIDSFMGSFQPAEDPRKKALDDKIAALETQINAMP